MIKDKNAIFILNKIIIKKKNSSIKNIKTNNKMYVYFITD